MEAGSRCGSEGEPMPTPAGNENPVTSPPQTSKVIQTENLRVCLTPLDLQHISATLGIEIYCRA
jgi:hypothetical protein